MNSDPRALRVTNDFIRPGADRFVGTIFEGDALLTLAATQDTASLFPQTTDLVSDGLPDSRPPITNIDVLIAMQAAKELVAWARTPSATTGKTPLEAFAKLAVNPR